MITFVENHFQVVEWLFKIRVNIFLPFFVIETSWGNTQNIFRLSFGDNDIFACFDVHEAYDALFWWVLRNCSKIFHRFIITVVDIFFMDNFEYMMVLYIPDRC